MRRIAMGIGRSAALAIGTALVTSCYGPDQTVMWVHKDDDGALTVVVPLCGSDHLTGVVVDSVDPEDGMLGYGPLEDVDGPTGEVTFTLDDDALRAGVLDGVGLPRAGTWAPGSNVRLETVELIKVYTSAGTTSVDSRRLVDSPGRDWVLHGDIYRGDDVPPPVTADEARAELDAYCG